ncbi:phage major capsid protein [Marivivens aquimaris]|uniref:phage major capsid protein n=1 Tax=Marivivens aquimaris TaxID=2774876 RepID=UPI00187E9232|nr:phage major capsid protein [Marivivens aquimaris]
MEHPEIKSRAGEDVSPAEDMKSALSDFMSEFKTFSDGIDARFQQQEDRMTKLDRKSLIAARPVLSAGAHDEVPHQKAFAAYLRSGDDEGLRDLPLEGKAMSSTVAADGGYLVDPQTSDHIKSALNSTASLRAIASIVTVEATSYDLLVDHADMGAGWANEDTATGETAAPQIDRITIPLNELSAMPKVSQRLLDDSAFDIENWLASRIADKFARSEASAFVAGNGADKPKGFLTYPVTPNASWEWGKIGYVSTGVSGGIETGDPIIELVYALGAEYRAGASFVMNSKTAGTVRKLKDADGRFLWSDGLSQGEPARLMGYPVLIAEDMPDVAAGANAIAFGDFAQGYTIAERPDVRLLRDPFSAKPHVLFYATKRVGGAVSDFKAIKLLKFAA